MPHLTTQELTTKIQNWETAPSYELAALFSFVNEGKRNRYDRFTIDTSDFGKTIKNLNTPPGDSMILNNISTVSIRMGANEEGGSKVFSPILQVNLYEAKDGQKEYYFAFYPDQNMPSEFVSDAFVLPESILPDSKISTEIAELFILKWHCLSENEIVQAFEANTTNKITYHDTQDGRKAFAELGPLKMLRVKSYLYDAIKTQQLIAEIIHYENNFENTSLILYTGAGLQVPNFYPFNFRPVLKVHAIDTRTGQPQKVKTYFDTSRPCPPFCPEAVAVNNTTI